ncbi:MAG: UvrD-helicase domain-containing protein [Planctomycetota bacterium]
MAKLMLHRNLLRDFGGLPTKVQKRVYELVERFQENSKDASLHLHPLKETMLDPKVRGANLVDGYRAIIIAPERGDTFLLMHVDKHDAAYDWAKNKRFEVHSMTGAFQVFDVQEAKNAAKETDKYAKVNHYPLAKLSDDDLFQAGTPRELIPAVRAINSDDGFDALEKYLPQDCRDVLRGIAAGMKLDEALSEMLGRVTATEVQPSSPGDFTKIAQAPNYDLVPVENEDDLRKVLSSKLEEWRLFLHPYQRKLVEWQTKGAMNINGAAGTGKTVVLMHRAAHLAGKLDGASSRILITTFTTTLALTIQDHLKRLAPSLTDRIEVVNLHALARTICARTGWKGRIAEDQDRADIWEQVWIDPELQDLPVSKEEVRREFDLVVDANGLDDEDAYLTCIRSGRPRLTRPERKKLWPAFQLFQRNLKRRDLLTFDGAVHQARLAVQQGKFTKYSHVLVDEVQDFGLEALRLIRALSPIDADHPDPLCTVGDGHQRIYGAKIPLSRAGIDVRGRSRRLKINYRTSEQIRTWAQQVLEGLEIDDLNGGVASTLGDKSVFRGPSPKIERCTDSKHEAETINKWAQGLVKDRGLPTYTVCVTPYKKEIRAALQAAGLPTYELRPREEDPGESEPGIRMGTMKRIKGLEFRAVALACADPSDPLNRKDAEAGARCERYVAATRAREHLLVTLAK